MPPAVDSASLSLSAQLDLARAARTAARVGARAPRVHTAIPQTTRREALATRKSFRECCAILEGARL